MDPVDEPIADRRIPTLAELDRIVPARCEALANRREKIKRQAGFHRWPKIADAKRSDGNRIRRVSPKGCGPLQ